MLDLEAIENKIRDWALLASGREVVWSKDDGSQPTSPFVSLDTTSMIKTHEDDVGTEVDENNEITIVSHRMIVVNILVLGSSDNISDSAMQVASNIEASLSKSSTQISFRDDCISIIDSTDPRDVSHLYGGTSWEKRAVLDVTFGFAFENKDNVGYFDTIEISGSIKDSTGRDIKNSDITVP